MPIYSHLLLGSTNYLETVFRERQTEIVNWVSSHHPSLDWPVCGKIRVEAVAGT